MSLDEQLQQELAHLADLDRLRICPPATRTEGTQLLIEGRRLLNFCSNDYLGLATAPQLHAAAAAAAQALGVGAGASRLVCGDHPALRALEETLATTFRSESAVVFPTGYQANLGLLTALAGPEDLILSDALNHASLVDGCRLSRAQVRIYRHADVQDAERQLASALASRPEGFRRRFLVTESVFSMDGDVAPLRALASLAAQHDAHLLVDEAHALGVMGPRGEGVCTAEAVSPAARVGTLGKAFGASGGFVLGSETLRHLLVNRARTFIFTTALPPPVAAAATAALALAASDEGEARRARLMAGVRHLHEALGRTGRLTPILPHILGPDRAALEASKLLSDKGFFVQAIRPPTVPAGTARLRITLSASHEPKDISALAQALQALPLQISP